MELCPNRSIAVAIALLLIAAGQVAAANFVRADVTTLLGPTFFVDDAAIGGTDTTVNQPSSGTYIRTFAGLLAANQGTTTVRITGLGFATSASATSNDATSLAVSITYLGADGAVGGGDDVVIGSATGAYAYEASGEYGCIFDTPLVATLNITALKFSVSITPANAGANGSVLFKTATIPFDGTTGPKLSIAGTASNALNAVPQRVNLARYQSTTASTENGQYLASYLTDGVVGNANSWRSLNVTTAHWVEVDFLLPVTIRSAHVYTGIDDGLALSSFRVQYASGAAWVDAPGSSVTGNASTEVNVIFTSSVTSDRFRLYSDVDGNIRVKELALYPPNPDASSGIEQGFPIGTDVELNLARERPVTASAANGTNYAKLAVDGFVSSASKWQTNTTGTNTLDLDLRVATKVGSAHVYSGDGIVAPIASFTLQSWDGSAWVDIPGGTVSGNTSAARVVTFTTSPTTSMVRLTFTNPSVSVVREICVFPANGGTGYPIGQDVLGTAPPTKQFEDFEDAYYAVQNRAAALPMSVSGTVPAFDPGGQDATFSQYQVLLNVGTDTYRLRNRATGKCLAGAGLSTASGAALVDQDYTAMAYQNWRFVSVDGTDYFLVNQWSGLVADSQSGGIAAGTPLVQATLNGTTSQRWSFVPQAHFPKKGMAGFLDRWASTKGFWAYNWGRTNSTSGFPGDVVFNPMQWGNFNWNIGDAQGPLEQFISEWRRADASMHLMGFNEPDGATQSNLTVDQVLSFWPRLERMDMPLASPVTVSPDNAWMNDFMTRAQALGQRIDVIAAHNYPSPNAGSSDALVGLLQTFNTTWNRPVWLTEFSTVDWNHTGSGWTEEDNYNWLAEFLWRAESLPWLQRYALFLFTADVTWPEPTNPWDDVAPRSNAFKADGTTPTSFGELYFAWDGDATVREDKAYFLHNKGERKRMRNAVGSTTPDHRYIRDGGDTVQWVLRPSGTAGQYYITSLRDGRRLRCSNNVVDFAPALTTGSTVRWSIVEDQYGWVYIENPAAPAANRRLKDTGGAFSVVSNTNTGDQIKWRFVVPYAPVDAAAPSALANLASTAGDTQVALTWTATNAADFSFYSVYRSTTSGGPFTLVATNLTSASYTNTGLQNGTGYYYTVTATDWTGAESTLSSQAIGMPVIATLPKALGVAASGGNITISWPSTHLGWILETQSGGLNANNWTTVSGSTTTNSMTWSIPAGAGSTFYRLKHP